MTKYYEGKIIENTDRFFNSESIYLDFFRYNDTSANKYYVDNHGVNTSSRTLIKYLRSLSSSELGKIVNNLFSLTQYKYDSDIKRKTDKIFSDLLKLSPSNYFSRDNLFYRKVYDQEGNEYAEEILSEEIIPITNEFNDYDVKYEDRTKDNKKIVFFDEEKGVTYKTRGSSLLEDNSGHDHAMFPSDMKKLNSMCEGKVETVTIDDLEVRLIAGYAMNISINVKPKIVFPNKRVDYVVVDKCIACEKDIDEFVKDHTKGLRGRKYRKDFIEKTKRFSKSNYLGENLHFSYSMPTFERVRESNVTNELQEIEFMLTKLKAISKSDYDTLYEEYQELFNQKAQDVTEATIITFKNKVYFTILCGGDINQQKNYLVNLITQYINNIKSEDNKKSGLTIKDIDAITNRLLSAKNNYGIKEQNDLLKYLSLLYFFEIHEDIDSITSDDLRNSYVLDNIKRVIVGISVLHDEGIITNMPNDLFNISNISELLDFISKIEFNNIDEVKRDDFIKKIQL